MGKIVPHLWFDNHAKEAIEFYTGIFENSKITNEQKIIGTPSGENTWYYEFELAGQNFQAINGGPLAGFNPSTSLMVAVKSKEEADALWKQFIDEGTVLMALDKYPFNKYYGWLEDKYGLSWQVIYDPEASKQQKISPSLLFSEKMTGKAEEAIKFYTGIFKDGKIEDIHKYQSGEVSHPQAEVAFSSFNLIDTQFHATDNGNEVEFTFNEALSFMVLCTTQAEIDYYWEKLSAVPEAEECGWLKDKYGVSWQIVPRDLNELFETGTEEQIKRAIETFLEMKKINMETLEIAWQG